MISYATIPNHLKVNHPVAEIKSLYKLSAKDLIGDKIFLRENNKTMAKLSPTGTFPLDTDTYNPTPE
jgi:hypothetical protein